MTSTDSMDSRFNTRDLFEGGMRVLMVLLVAVVLLVTLDWLLRSDTYKVNQLQFEGTFERVSENELEQALLPIVNGNYLMLDLDRMRQAVEALPWVNQAWIRRSWPNGIHIRFVEEQPVALWGSDKSVSADGHVIPAVEGRYEKPLPRLSGPEGTSQSVLAAYRRFQSIIGSIGEQIRSLQLTSRRTWQITLASGTVILVDQHQSDSKLQRLAKLYRRIGEPVKRVDLRYTNGFAVNRASTAGFRPAEQ